METVSFFFLVFVVVVDVVVVRGNLVETCGRRLLFVTCQLRCGPSEFQREKLGKKKKKLGKTGQRDGDLFFLAIPLPFRGSFNPVIPSFNKKKSG